MSSSAPSSTSATLGSPSRVGDCLGELVAGAGEVLGVEDRANQRCQQPVLVLARVPETT